MPSESGLPGWFPDDFGVDDALLDAFEQEPAGVKKKTKPTENEGQSQPST